MKAHREVAIVWFRQDLRLEDNSALRAAIHNQMAVIPLYLWTPEEEGHWPLGAAGRWWLHQSLQALDQELRQYGSKLILRCGESSGAIIQVAKEAGAARIYWNRRYEPAARARDDRVRSILSSRGFAVETFDASLLFDPGIMKNKQGTPYKVFTAYWVRCLSDALPGTPRPRPKWIPAPRRWPPSLSLAHLKLEPEFDWTKKIRATWRPGAEGARRALRKFLGKALSAYAKDRDFPAHAGTSRLSPHLHFGEISPRSVWHAVRQKRLYTQPFLRQLGWREFSYYLMYHFPQTPQEPFRPAYGRFPWKIKPAQFKAWRKGQTGYPIVDAGMRELWAMGWMHNRVRLIVASFLVKHLLIPWQEGAKWFWDTLVDADLANNSLGWQWVAGCGADAAPYFRIFNPVLQGEKFDPEGDYVRRWVGELKRLPKAWIHKPWDAPHRVLSQAGIVLGKHYPKPIVEHEFARQRALGAHRKTVSHP
ncbi:MAG: deoxyribodipyrimidine photo-lyase [Candidatus Omnitrophica bacterium]|nr:deoxyribodipyrimidine photo-lyase [Candidatus Omnitrophota bacterium]MDD5670151.1 deoxyribodipyrimidine photo-lyase [Candidatus Omnitrophota bacterium]